MRRTVPIRLFAVALAVGSLTAIPLSSPAFAAGAASCSKLVSLSPTTVKGVSMSNATVSGCLPAAATGGTGKSVTNLKTFVSTTTWAGGKGTTIVKISYKAAPQGKCPSTASHVLSIGKVTGGSGAALKVIKVGQSVSASVCVNKKTSAASLEPGTKYVF